MKTKMHVLKASFLGLAILLVAGNISAQKVTGEKTGKEIIKGEQTGGKEGVKAGETTTTGGGKEAIKGDGKTGKEIVKGNATDGKNAIKNPDGTTTGATEGTVEGGSDVQAGTRGTQDGTSSDATEGTEAATADGGSYARDASMDGKAYDQARLDAAKGKCQTMIDAANSVIAAEEQHIQDAKAKIQAAQDAVTVMKADKKADQAVIASKEGLIAQANAMVAQLEQQIGAGKAAVERAKALLTPAVAAK